jgi:hypothetical protein
VKAKAIDVLPAPKSPDFNGTKVYVHFMIAQSIDARLRATAFARGYKPAAFLEELLDAVLPKKIKRKYTKRATVPAKIKLLRSATRESK